MEESSFTPKELVRMVLPKWFALILFLLILFFLPAGTWNYWQACVYMLVLLIPMSLVMPYLVRHNPGLLRRRMQFKERRTEQRKIIYLSYPFFLLMFLLPGFDRRFGWSQAPVWVVIAANILILLGYWIVFQTFKANTYASRVIEVDEGQQVIRSGPYAVVRHPMYVGVLLMYFFTPLALGSWLALIPALSLVPTIVLRILDEEKALAQDLPGYPEYMAATRFRLIPGVW